VEGRDLVVVDDVAYMKTIQPDTRRPCLLTRWMTNFIDPLAFRSDSLVGVPGLMNALPRREHRGWLTHRHRWSADDKAIYAYVPDFIKYYLRRRPILHNVETYLCSRPIISLRPDICELVVKAWRIRRIRQLMTFGGPETTADFPRTPDRRSPQLHRAAGDSPLARAFLRRRHRRYEPASCGIFGLTVSMTARRSPLCLADLLASRCQPAPSW